MMHFMCIAFIGQQLYVKYSIDKWFFEFKIMNKYKAILIIGILISVLSSFLSFAGEFKLIDDKLYFNNGTKNELSEGWLWIIGTDSVAYKYFVHEGFVLRDIPTLDGNVLDKKGRLIENGKLATASLITDTMFVETNWDKFGGNYHIAELEDTSHNIQKFGQFEWPVKVTDTGDGYIITWNGIYKGTETFYISDTVFSMASKEGTYIDVIDENNFRLVFSSGEEAMVVRITNDYE